MESRIWRPFGKQVSFERVFGGWDNVSLVKVSMYLMSSYNGQRLVCFDTVE